MIVTVGDGCPITILHKQEIDELMKKYGIIIGTEFEAKSKGCTYNYRFIGYGDLNNICFSIHLRNIDNKTDTYVEPEWFRQRFITIKQ